MDGPVGRERELAAVLAAVERARQQSYGALLLLEGEAGIGKTTVLGAVAAAVARRGVAVVRAESSQLERTRPFGPLHDAFAAAGREALQELLATPTDRSTAERRSPLQTVPADRSATIERFAALVEAWTEEVPVLLVVDDLHWADPATLAAIGRLHRVTEHHALVVVAALRPVPRDADVDALVAGAVRAGASRLPLGPLDAGAVGTLLQEAVDGPPGPGLREAAAKAGGNPFLVLELVRALDRGGRIATLDGVVDLVAGSTTGDLLDVRAAVLARMADLGAEAGQLLRVAAALAPSFSVGELAAVLGQAPAALLPVIGTAIDAGLLIDDGPGVRFRHDLVREVVESSIGPSALAALHLDIARTLAASGAPAVRVAPHYARGAQPGDRAAVSWLRAAAADIAPRAPTSAAELLERALAVCSVGDPERDAVVTELVDAAFWGGDVDRAVALASDALARPLDPALATRLHETTARALTVMGRPAEAMAHADRLVGLGEQLAWATALRAVFGVFGLDLDGAAADGRAAIELATAEGGGDVWAETLAYCVLCWEENARGFHEPAVTLAEQAVRAADRSPDREAHRLVPYVFLGMSLESCGRTDEAAAALAHGLALTEHLGTAWAAPFYRYITALPHWNAGRWDECLAECDAGLRDAREHGIGLGAAWACAIGATAHLFRDELDAAATLLDEGDARLAEGGVQFGVDWLLRARALLFEAQGDKATALALLQAGWDVAEGLRAAAALVVLGPDLVRVAVDQGALDAARAATDALERGEVSEARLNIDAHARRCRGLVDQDVELLAEAIRLHDACHRPVEVALDEEALVLTLARLGRMDEAAVALTACVARCDVLDMPFVAERVRRDAAALGLARPRRRAPKGTTGWAALTETERLVAGLVAAGRSNPHVAAELLISRRTVESHLYRIFFKLGVTNRTELALVAVREGATP
jgi:ATP/maltotriose-dependent transcriptional regulator MalT